MMLQRKYLTVGAILLWLVPTLLSFLGILTNTRLAAAIEFPGLLYIAIRLAKSYCKSNNIDGKNAKVAENKEKQ